MPRVLAYYLPQYHPVPENDKFWGKGFTEWTNVAQAKPLFKKHRQPRIPSDLGFYDLRVSETREAQADLARSHGVEGFCYWHYWFGGKRVLQRPFEEVLESGRPNFPFCLGWANDSWKGVWHGAAGKTLIEQTYPGASVEADHIAYLIAAFKDDRYIKVDGCPLFVIYKPMELPDRRAFRDKLESAAHREGFPGVYLVGMNHVPWNPQTEGFDACTQNLPSLITQARRKAPFGARIHKAIRRRIGLQNRSLPQIIEYPNLLASETSRTLDNGEIPCVLPDWDNTPRLGSDGVAIVNSTPQLFSKYLSWALNQVEQRPADQRIIFVKSWNEWAEGNYMEPDMRWGSSYLQATRKAIETWNPSTVRSGSSSGIIPTSGIGHPLPSS